MVWNFDIIKSWLGIILTGLHISSLWHSEWTCANMQLQSDSCPMEQMAMIATVGNTIQTVNSPVWIYECSWQHSEARNSTQQHTDNTKLSFPGWDGTYNICISQHTAESAQYPTMPARHCWIVGTWNLYNQQLHLIKF